MNLPDLVSVPCPLCENPHNSTEYKINSIAIVKCTVCNFVYANPRLTKEKIIELYHSNYFDNESIGYNHYLKTEYLRKKNFEKWIKDSLSYVPNFNNRSALDIGCAAGVCREELTKSGFYAEGEELNHPYAGIAKRKGFIVYNNPLLASAISRKYNLITLFDVLEHLSDIRLHLCKMYDLLEKNGALVIVTPNYGSAFRKISGRKWFQFKPLEHINYFTLHTLKKAAGSAGFEIVLSKKAGQYCDWNFLDERLSKYKLKRLRFITKMIFSLFSNKNKLMYIPTSSLYVILKKAS